jgi:hypothetical protein
MEAKEGSDEREFCAQQFEKEFERAIHTTNKEIGAGKELLRLLQRTSMSKVEHVVDAIAVHSDRPVGGRRIGRIHFWRGRGGPVQQRKRHSGISSV